MPNTGHP